MLELGLRFVLLVSNFAGIVSFTPSTLARLVLVKIFWDELLF